jgi:cobalt-zinc-cadmium efflux system outer membrane protein
MKAIRAFIPLLFLANLFATDIDMLISKAYENNPTLKKIESQIQASQYDIKNSDIYKNPVLSIGANDINIDDPSNRELEPMQTQYITIAQEITDTDKLEYKTKIAKINKQILQTLLEDKKDQIVKTIYSLSYSIKELEQKIKLNDQKLDNTTQIKNYFENNIQNKDAFQKALKSELMIDNIKLMNQIDMEKISQLYSKLSEVVNEDISSIDSPNQLNFKNKLKDHKLLQIQELNIKKAHTQKALAKENESSDITLSAGYFQRQKYDDYVNIAIKFPLNIYEKESNELQKSFRQIDISKSKFDEVENTLERRFKVEYSKNRLANKSIKYMDMIISNLQKEKELISNQNSNNSVIKALNIENKIIDEKIKKLSFEKQKSVSSVELAYLTSTITKE